MTNLQLELFITLVFIVSVYWLLPFKYRMHFVSFSTFVFMVFQSPVTALVFSTGTLLCYLACRWYFRARNSKIIFCAVAFYALFFLFYQYFSQNNSIISIIGFAYFICRQIHFLIEVFKRNITTINLSRLINYQFYLPVIFAGPIHQYMNFQSESLRANFSTQNISLGVERIVYGFFKLVVIGNYLIQVKLNVFLISNVTSEIALSYCTSIIIWTYIYFAFSGLTDIALGFSRIMGIRLEENFNHPYKANTLLEFWSRWHMTLTGWARDYIFMPVFLGVRSRIIAVVAALITIGFWHEISMQYVIWGAYQSLGIILCKYYQNKGDFLKLEKLPKVVELGVKKIATFLWLVSLTPLLSIINYH